jgi:hypothetical protein
VKDSGGQRLPYGSQKASNAAISRFNFGSAIVLATCHVLMR